MLHFYRHPFGGTLLFISLLLAFPTFSLTKPHRRCDEGFFLEVQKRLNTTLCKRVVLRAGFGWKYNNNNQSARTLEILFMSRLDEQRMEWMAWGLNPGPEARMAGTRALMGIKRPNGVLTIERYNITKDIKQGCKIEPSRIDLHIVKNEFLYKQPYYMIYAQIVLPIGEYNENMTNIVWQVGNLGPEGQPSMHAKTLRNYDSTQTMNLVTGRTRTLGYHHKRHLRMAHGILNMMGWGTLLPIGVIIARYFRGDPIKCTKMWYRIHVGCQIAGWGLGTSGWILGLWLGQASKHYYFPIHRTLGIFIFTFSTLQMLALRMKPDLSDDYREYWNMYHHFLGYALIATIIVNIFRGVKILSYGRYYWTRAYIGTLISLGCIALLLEILAWKKFLKDKENANKGDDVENDNGAMDREYESNQPPNIHDDHDDDGASSMDRGHDSNPSPNIHDDHDDDGASAMDRGHDSNPSPNLHDNHDDGLSAAHHGHDSNQPQRTW